MCNPREVIQNIQQHNHLTQQAHSSEQSTFQLPIISIKTNPTIKMRFTSTSAALFLSTLISSSSAIITGVTAPSTVYAYNPFTVTLTTADYIQSVYDVAVAFGVAPGAGYPDSLGNVVSTAFLGPSKSNILTPITFDVTLPAGTGDGEYVLTAAVYSLLGAAYEPSVTEYNTTITVAGY
jgi:hypothetical protein